MKKRRKIASIATLALLLLATKLWADPVILTMWSQDSAGATTGVVEAFNKSHSDIQIDLAHRDFSSLVSDLTRAFAMGKAPDIIEVDNPEIAIFSSRGLLLPLDEKMKTAKNMDLDKMVPGMRDAGTWEGKLYAIPKAANTIALFYNADLFRKAGLDPENPPKTWSELSDYAAKLNDPVNKIYGLSFCAAPNEEGTFQFLPFAQMLGADYDSIDSEGAVKALKYWKELYTSGNVNPDSISRGQWDMCGDFNAGKTAMHISGPWEITRMSESAKFEWRVALLPSPDEGLVERSSALGEFMHGINAKTEHPDEAFEFIDFYHSFDTTMADKFGVLPGFLVEYTPKINIEANKVFSEQLKYAHGRGPRPDWPKISKAIQTAIQDTLTGKTEPEKALKKAAKTINKIMK